MTQALVQYETAPTAAVVTDEQIELIKRTVAKDATQAELQLYLYDCQRHGVHPLDRLLHFTKRSGKYTPITSIDLLRSRAADTGDLAGIDDPQYQGEPMAPDFRATVTVWRIVQGQRCPFTATARWSEYKPGENDFMWRKMPYLMLGKVSEALALRKAFPRQLSGLYAREEMDQAGNSGAAYIPPARAQIVDTATGEITEPPANPTEQRAPASNDNPMHEKRKRLAELRTQANREKKAYTPPKSPADMSQLELDAAINQIEILLAPADNSALYDEVDAG
jgi:phage recombination protein Bet